MDRLDPAQARDHIEMVDRILEQTQQRLCGGAEFFIVWGLYSAIVTSLWQLVRNGIVAPAVLWAQLALLLAAIAFTVLRGRWYGARAPRRSLVQREFFNVLWLTLGLAFVANVAAFNVFSGWAQAAIWSFAEAIVLFFIGLHGNPRALLGGIAVVVSLIAANFVGHDVTGFVLAAGMLAGYCGFGIADLLARD
jgi:hypothetical protein